MTRPVSPAEEAVAAAMLSSLFLCGAVSYVVSRVIGEWRVLDAFVLAIVSFVVSGFFVPRVCAWWLGRSIHGIFRPDTAQRNG